MDRDDKNYETEEIDFEEILKSDDGDAGDQKDTETDDDFENELEIEERPDEDDEADNDYEQIHEDEFVSEIEEDFDNEEELKNEEKKKQQSEQLASLKNTQTKTLTIVRKDVKKPTPPPPPPTYKPSPGQPTILNSMMQNKVVASSSGFIRIAPKTTAPSTATNSAPSSSTTMTTVAKNANGKIIYLQRPGGKTVPVRVPNSIATNSSSANNQTKQTVAIHVVRTPDGNFVPYKSGKDAAVAATASGTNKMVGNSKLVTSPSGGKVLMKAPVKSTPTTLAQARPPRSIGSTIVSAVETKPKVRQIITSKQVVTNSNNGGGKVVMQSGSNAAPRQVMVSGNMIRMSPNTSTGQLQAVQIPGKSGVQYVRVLNNTQSGISQHKVVSSDSSNLHKYTVVNQPNKQSIVVKSPLTDKDRHIKMTTVPTYRKINDVIVRTNESINPSLVRTQKISQINSQIGRLCSTSNTNTTNKTDAPPNKCIVVSKSSLIRSSVTSQNQKIMQQRQSIIESRTSTIPSAVTSGSKISSQPPKKLFSILRPSTVEPPQIRPEIKAEPLTPKQKAEPFIVKPNKPTANNSSTVIVSKTINRLSQAAASPPPSDDSSNVTIRRKHCNCTKSQCLKLYCDCFANGEFCQDCNCKDCLNNLDNEDERQKAIRICLDRNPNSFKPKITAAANESDLRLHNKGCNCKRSGCLKNYCECYEAKIPCSSNCKCIGCRNVDDHPDLDMDTKKCAAPTNHTTNTNRGKRTYEMITPKVQAPMMLTPAVTASMVAASGPPAEKQPCNFITQEVVDATIQCLIAQADECEKGELTPYQTEKMVMEELGRCLVEIIDFSIRNTD